MHTARRMLNRTLLSILLIASALSACKSPGPEGPPPATDLDATREQVLVSLGSTVVLPTLEAFASDAAALKTAVDALANAPEDAGAIAAAQQAWREAMTGWQRAEVMQFGPTADQNKPGGRDLRHHIYSWPAVSSCRIDQVLVGARWEEPGFFDGQLVNVYGLDALEYLLFHRAAGNTCSSSTDINSSGAWAALGEAEIARRRASYARAVAERLVADAQRLVAAWSPEGENFVGQLTGGEGSVYRTSREALDAVFGALFYLDITVKDSKLALPTGLGAGCGSNVCPDDAESRWSRHAKENLAANLRAGQALFFGNEPGEEPRPGFDDLLNAVDAEPLAKKFDTAFDEAIRKVDAIPGTLQESLTTDPEPARAAYAAVKALTDLLKIDLVMTLKLEKPAEGAGDTD